MNWLSVLELDIFRNTDILNMIYERIYDVLNRILENLFKFCDCNKFMWYHRLYKTKRYEEIENKLRDEIDQYNLENYINIDIDLPYEKIRNALFEKCEKYLGDYFIKQDDFEHSIPLKIQGRISYVSF